MEGARVRYEIIAETYRDLERSSARLELIERLAGLVRQTPDELLPTVALLCQGCRRSRNSLPDERDVQVIPCPRVHGMPHPAGVRVPATGLLA
jgi:hypothetical protein